MMQVFPIACESLGTRATCHLVITDDTVILIDASVALGPRRYGLPPHPLEVAMSYFCRQIILEAAAIADHVTITHYHADHYSLPWTRVYEFSSEEIATRIYRNKIVWAKNTDTVNYNQKRRAYWLWKQKNLDVRPADGASHKIGNTVIQFSEPLYHGTPKTKMGTVVAVSISDSNKKWLYTSDVSGPGDKSILKFIRQEEPDYVVVDGPASYHPRVSKEEVAQGLQNLANIYDLVPSVVVEHHFLRATDWKQVLKEQVGVDHQKILTFADYAKTPNVLLEQDRKKLHQESPPPKDFYHRLNKMDAEFRDFLKVIAKKIPTTGYLNKTVLREIKKRQEQK